MHAFNTLLTLPLVLLTAVLPTLASPTLHPRLHAVAPREFEYHHHTHTRAFEAAPTAAAAAPPTKRNPIGDCNVAGQHCCNSAVSHNSSTANLLGGLLGSNILPDSNMLVGLECTPLAPILAASGQCTGTMVCCSGDQHYDGLINIGCSPISL